MKNRIKIKPQSAQRYALSTHKEYKGIHIAQSLTYLKAAKIGVGHGINFNVERLKDGIKRIILLEITEKETRINSFKSINIKLLLCVLCGFLHYLYDS